jgi:hypothetical protein
VEKRGRDCFWPAGRSGSLFLVWPIYVNAIIRGKYFASSESRSFESDLRGIPVILTIWFLFEKPSKKALDWILPYIIGFSTIFLVAQVTNIDPMGI